MGWDKYTDWGAGKGGKYVPPTPEQSKEIRDILKKLQGGKKAKKHQDRPEDVPRYKGGNPGGKLIDIDWMKKEYEKKHPKLEQLNKDKYHKDLKISGLSEFDTFMQNMRRGSQKPKSGSIKHHPPHIQKLILGIGKRIRA